MRPVVAATSSPRLPRGVRLRFDPVREAWVLLAPERVLFPDEIAARVLASCDGARDVARISRELALDFDAPRDTIEADVVALLQELADDGFLET